VLAVITLFFDDSCGVHSEPCCCHVANMVITVHYDPLHRRRVDVGSQAIMDDCEG
jgi:hypothetical protein